MAIGTGKIETTVLSAVSLEGAAFGIAQDVAGRESVVPCPAISPALAQMKCQPCRFARLAVDNAATGFNGLVPFGVRSQRDADALLARLE